MTTTNGTPALLASASARRILIASFLNLGAVVEALAAEEDAAVTIVCSGREKRFSLDDAVCAGALVTGLRERLGPDGLELNDAAYTAALAARARLDELEQLLGRTAAGRQLIEAGLGEDLAFCAQLDRHAIVPHFRDRQVTL
jgi:2-phosphosulfolactate phosphatase